MRPKIVIIVLTLGLFVFGTFFAIRHAPDRSNRNTQPQPTPASAPEPGDSLASERTQSEPVAAPSGNNSVQSTLQGANTSQDTHQAYVEQRTAELMDMAMTDERANLDSILPNFPTAIRKFAKLPWKPLFNLAAAMRFLSWPMPCHKPMTRMKKPL